MSHGDTHAAHGSLKEYVIGLILSIVLTAIPFALVMTNTLSPKLTMIIIGVCAVAQLLVQMIFFLHMRADEKNEWNIVTGLYTITLVVCIVIGTLWIFMHLNHNMLMGH